METNFLNKNLEELFETGKSKKYKKVPKNIIEGFVEAVEFLKDAVSIQDIWKHPSYNFEHLSGTKKYSMRLNRKWRLELSIEWIDDTKVEVKVVNILDLTSHYQ